MFIGHFGVAFGAKKAAPKVSLGTLLLAAQFIDLLWPVLLLLGIERVRIEPGATVVTPLAFESYPVSHSLLAVIGWGILFFAVYSLLKHDRRAAFVLFLCVLSHWFLDAIVHRPDLQLYPGGELRVGLNVWSSLPATLVLEGLLFSAGILLYTKATKPADAIGKWALWTFILFIVVMYVGNLLGPPPPSVKAIAILGNGQWLLVAWAYWIDRHRSSS